MGTYFLRYWWDRTYFSLLILDGIVGIGDGWGLISSGIVGMTYFSLLILDGIVGIGDGWGLISSGIGGIGLTFLC